MHDYLLATIGGVMIGSAAVLLMATHGKIMGVSGILSNLISPAGDGKLWRLMFLLGTLFAVPLYSLMATAAPVITITSNLPLLIIGGLLVGIGTVTGSGCTSGHGVCGLSRFSTRSLIATVTFMISGGVTVYVMRHVLGGAA